MPESPRYGGRRDGEDDANRFPSLPTAPGRTKLNLRRRGTIWHMYGTLNGKPFRKSTGTDDERRAEQIRSATEHKCHVEAIFGREPDPPTLAQVIRDYIAAVHPKQDTINRLSKLAEIAGPQFRADKATQAWLEKTVYPLRFPGGSSDATKLRDCYTPLHAALMRAFKSDTLQRMPKLIKPSSGGRATGYLTVDDVEAMLPHLDVMGATFLELMVSTGPRRSNACKLAWHDVDLRHGWVTYQNVKDQHGKNTDLRIKLYPRAQAALERLASKVGRTQGTVFTGPQQGCFVSRSAFGAFVTKMLQRSADRASLERRIGCQLLRRTFASWHQAAFGDSKLLADVGGWSSIEMANSYSELAAPEMGAQVAQFWGLGTNLTHWKIPSVKIVR